MRNVSIPCSCEDEEHEVEIEAEVAYPNRIGLYAPNIGDPLPCGRLITQDDIDAVIERLEDFNKE